MGASTVAWDVSGLETVADGVHRVPLPLPEDGLLASAFRGLGYEGGDVHDVLVTHVHRDHYTQAMWLRRDHGARVSLGAGERPGLDRLFEIRTNVPVEAIEQLRLGGGTELARELATFAWPDFDPSSWGYPDRWINDGDTIGPLEAVATPGHTRGHTVFHDADRRLLFAGDHLLPSITPSIGFELGRPPLPLGDFLTSLQVILGRPDARLLPAHGPVAESGRERARGLLEHHRVRFLATLDVIDDCGSSAWQVASRLPWTRHSRRFDELDGFNQMLAVCETAAHLDVLVSHDALSLSQQQARRVYTLTGLTPQSLMELLEGHVT